MTVFERAVSPATRATPVARGRLAKQLAGRLPVVAVDILAASIVLLFVRPGPVAAAAIVLWPLLLTAAGGYDCALLGGGWAEFRRVLMAGAWSLGLAAVGSAVLGIPVAAKIALLVPATVTVSLLGRLMLRRAVQREWTTGQGANRVLIVGDANATVSIAGALSVDPRLGWNVVGACTPEPDDVASMSGVLRLAAPERVGAVVAEHDIDVVLFVPGPAFDGEVLRRLSWDLEQSCVRVLVAPDLREVMPHRVIVRPAGSLPLLEVAQPAYRGVRRQIKRVLEWTAAAAGLIVLSPVLLVIGILVRVTSPGPVFFAQTRMGYNGRPFTCYKFRTMIQDAEQVRSAGLEQFNEHDGHMFKIRHDPRITPVGRFLRRFSLDELPQLWHVVRGQMSLIGPRPPMASEVGAYLPHELRRLNVRPGLTGLWQVSGRSDLSWERTIELDLRYVENWSLTLDAVILWKTARAVLSGKGAY
jgi:exopolysaccharide biosynthesis polyprenyl glycosylphosphotransferase